jgi:hypothetical protein
LCGALCDGKIFLWDRDHDKIQFITGLPKVFNDADKGNSCVEYKSKKRVEHFFLCVLSNAGFAAIFFNFAGNTKNQIFFSPCGNMMLLMMGFEKIFLWQKSEKDDPGNVP